MKKYSFGKKINQSPDIKACTPKDDAFHGSTSIPSAEWWYFDSMFKNDYSAHIGFKIFTFKGISLLKPIINIYENSTLVANETTLLNPSEFSVSDKYPRIDVKNITVMTFNSSYFDQTGKYKYHVKYKINNVGVDLIFTSETVGWRYHTLHEGWTVAIPKGSVEGYIYLNDQSIPVTGRGYHDHNWNFSILTPARGWSWYWGKITGDKLNLAWAVIKDTGMLKQTFVNNLGVLNAQQDKFIVIDPEQIHFSTESFIFKNNRFIPTKFHLTIAQDDVFIDITFATEDLHRSDPSVMTVHYWRYFVTINGVMKYKDTIEYLDEKIQIMEFMRFI